MHRYVQTDSDRKIAFSLSKIFKESYIMEQSNKIMGIVGGIVGTVLGLIVWCLIGMAGYISWIGGLALAAGAFFGYKLLGKSMDKIGIVICAVFVLIAVFVGTRMNYAIQLHKDFEDDRDVAAAFEVLGLDTGVSTFEIFLDFGEYVDTYDDLLAKVGTDVRYSDDFKQDLAFGYVVTIIASAAIIASFVKKK